MGARRCVCARALVVLLVLVVGAASPIGGEEDVWAPTCERNGRGCSERERAFLYHWLAKPPTVARAELDRLVQARAGGGDVADSAQRWTDQRLHILDQLARSPSSDEL